MGLLARESCIRYGVVPYSNILEIEKSYIDWKKYIEKEINRCIKINFETSYGNLINKFAQNNLDMGFVGPFTYVLIKEVSGVEPIATSINSDGTATYKSHMVATKEVAQTLGIFSTLKGEKGMQIIKQKLQKYKKKWMIAFTDESSTAGYAIPNYYMKKVSLNPNDYFEKVTFVGTHDAAQLVVRNNIIPIAFGAEMFYTRLLKDNKISKESNKVIWESDDIPKSPIILKKELSAKLKQKLQDALISMPQDFVPRLAKEVGYIKTDENSYKIIEDIYMYLKR